MLGSLKDLLLTFAIDRVRDIAKGLLNLIIEAFENNTVDQLVAEIKNPVHQKIALIVVDIIERVYQLKVAEKPTV
jgi:hypothetical protein